MSNIAKLQAELAAKAKLAAAEATEKATEASLRAQLSLYSNEAYKSALVARVRQESSINMLKSYIVDAKAVLTAVPVYDTVKRQDKQWNGRVLYGHGIEFNNLYQLLSGIMYSSREHKELLLAQTGLSEAIIESTINAFGSPAYFSIRDGVVVDEIKPDTEVLTNNCMIIASTLNVELPMSEIAEDKLTKRFEQAYVRAQRDEAQHELTAAMVGDTNFTMS